MIQDQENLMHFIAEDGKVIVPKDREGTDFVMTEDIWIGSADSIDNYEEIDKPTETDILAEAEATEELVTPEPTEAEPTEEDVEAEPTEVEEPTE